MFFEVCNTVGHPGYRYKRPIGLQKDAQGRHPLFGKKMRKFSPSLHDTLTKPQYAKVRTAGKPGFKNYLRKGVASMSRKKRILSGGFLGILALAVVVGSLLTGGAFAQGSKSSQVDTEANAQAPSYASDIRVEETQNEGKSEAEEVEALANLAVITLEQAKEAALAANPGTTVVKVELDNENGALVYSVELSNGLDVKVDAGNGAILHTEQANTDEAEAADKDHAQEEFESQSEADEANEAPGVEDALGQ